MVATGDDLMDKVASVLQDVSHDIIEPRFEKLHQDDIRFKSPGEMVTVADELAERQLKARLGELVPDALFVGEEAFSDGSGLPSALRHQRIWLVDPLDGTANFVSGSPHWAVMAALVQDGETCAAWISQPVRKAMYRAEVGAGATRNGVPIERSPAPSAPGGLRGAVLTKFLDARTAERVDEHRHVFGSVGPGTTSAGVDYPMVADGEQDFVMFWRTLPWDHAPGALVVEESGGCVRRLDGRPYAPRHPGVGLLAAGSAETWQVVRDALLGE